jgi:protein phosphatase
VNEDRALVLPDVALFVVCDGVGGHNSGEVASQLAVDTIEEAFAEADGAALSDVVHLLERAVQYANRDIFETAVGRPEYEGMATTVALLHLDVSSGRAVVGHAGDSRVYRYDGRLHRETYDHTDLDDAVRAGRMTRAEAVARGKQNTINRALGVEHEVQAEFKTLPFREGDAFLLCSDGVTRHLDDSELEDLFAQGLTPEAMCEEIRGRCYSRGAEDNLTAVVVRTGNSSRGAPTSGETGRARFAADLPDAGQQRIQVSFGSEGNDRVSPASQSKPVAHARRPIGRTLLTLALVVAAFAAGRLSVGLWPRPVPPAVAPDSIGREALARDDLITARATFAQLAAREPERAEYQYWLGRTLDRQGESEEAMRHLERAVALDPTLADAYVYLAAAYERSGRRDLASQTLKKYAELGTR